jgi:nucleotide-binding universal stress UspA family protein
MTSMDQFAVGLPDGAALSRGSGGGGSLQRMLVPVSAPDGSAAALAIAARACAALNGTLRVVHIRIFDPPVRSCSRFYPESSAQATAVIEQALTGVWPLGIKASGVVIDAERPLLAKAVAAAARDWGAGVIVLTRRPRPAVARLLLGSVADQVMRHATCPVLVVRPEDASHVSR